MKRRRNAYQKTKRAAVAPGVALVRRTHRRYGTSRMFFTAS